MKNIFNKALSYPILTILLVALLVRFVCGLLYQYVTIYPDSIGYLYLSELLSEFNIHGYEGQRSPGYPLFISLLGDSYALIALVQSASGVVSLIYTYKLLLLVEVKETTSLVLTLLLACYLPIVFFELSILSESLTLLCITLIFYLFFLIRREETIGRLLGLTFLPGYLVLIKPFYIFLPILLVVFLLTKEMRKNAKRMICLLTLPFMIYFAWSYANLRNTGYFTPTTFYGFNLAQNCVSFAENTTGEYKDIGRIYAKYREENIARSNGIAMSIWDAEAELQQHTQLSFPDLSAMLYDYSKTTISHNILLYLKQVSISWRDFWKTSMYVEYPNFGVEWGADVVKYISLIQRILFQLVKVAFVLLIFLNSFCFFRTRQVTPSFIISIVVLSVSILQAMVTYGTNSRFSFPFELLILVSVVINAKMIFQSKYFLYWEK